MQIIRKLQTLKKLSITDVGAFQYPEYWTLADERHLLYRFGFTVAIIPVSWEMTFMFFCFAIYNIQQWKSSPIGFRYILWPRKINTVQYNFIHHKSKKQKQETDLLWQTWNNNSNTTKSAVKKWINTEGRNQ